MLKSNEVLNAAQSFGGVAVAYNPVKDTGIYEIILPTTDHKRQCCVVVTDNDMEPVSGQVVSIMATVSENRFRVCSVNKLVEVLEKL